MRAARDGFDARHLLQPIEDALKRAAQAQD